MLRRASKNLKRRGCSTVQYSTVQYSTVQYSTVQYSTVMRIDEIVHFINLTVILCIHKLDFGKVLWNGLYPRILHYKVEKGLEEPQKTDAGSAAEFEWIQVKLAAKLFEIEPLAWFLLLYFLTQTQEYKVKNSIFLFEIFPILPILKWLHKKPEKNGHFKLPISVSVYWHYF